MSKIVKKEVYSSRLKTFIVTAIVIIASTSFPTRRHARPHAHMYANMYAHMLTRLDNPFIEVKAHLKIQILILPSSVLVSAFDAF